MNKARTTNAWSNEIIWQHKLTHEIEHGESLLSLEVVEVVLV